MQVSNRGLVKRGELLRRQVEANKRLDHGTMTVSVDLLDEIFRGNVPVGGNEKPPEDVNAMLYELKAENARLRAATDTIPNRRNFDDELVCLLNKYSKENGSNTPDFVLADYIGRCLENFNLTVVTREEWHGRKFSPGSIGEREQLEGYNVSADFCGGLGGDNGGNRPTYPDEVAEPIRNEVARIMGNGPLVCACCGETSTNPGQFVKDGRWVCTEACRKDLPNVDSYDDLRASGGIVDAP